MKNCRKRAIVTAMKKFPNEDDLQIYGCSVLDEIAKFPDFQNAVNRAGGRRVLLNAIENHTRDKALRESASNLLKHLLP